MGQRNVGLQCLLWGIPLLLLCVHGLATDIELGSPGQEANSGSGTKCVRVRRLWSCSRAISDKSLCSLHTRLRFPIGNRRTGLGCFEVQTGRGSESFDHRAWRALLVNGHSTHCVRVASAPRKDTVTPQWTDLWCIFLLNVLNSQDFDNYWYCSWKYSWHLLSTWHVPGIVLSMYSLMHVVVSMHAHLFYSLQTPIN